MSKTISKNPSDWSEAERRALVNLLKEATFKGNLITSDVVEQDALDRLVEAGHAVSRETTPVEKVYGLKKESFEIARQVYYEMDVQHYSDEIKNDLLRKHPWHHRWEEDRHDDSKRFVLTFPVRQERYGIDRTSLGKLARKLLLEHGYILLKDD